jgi:hypothetical protein
VRELEVFISELRPVDGLSSGSVPSGEVSPLTHEVRDDPVEHGALVAEALLTRAQRSEVLCRLRDYVLPELGNEQGCYVMYLIVMAPNVIVAKVKSDSTGFGNNVLWDRR